MKKPVFTHKVPIVAIVEPVGSLQVKQSQITIIAKSWIVGPSCGGKVWVNVGFIVYLGLERGALG